MKRAYKVLIKGVLCLSRPPTGCTLHQHRLEMFCNSSWLAYGEGLGCM